MKWREFITLLGGTAATLPIVARAQQPTMPVIGYLSAGSAESFAENLAIFQRSVAEAGYVEGQNVARISLVERSSRPPAGTGGRYVCFRGKSGHQDGHHAALRLPHNSALARQQPSDSERSLAHMIEG